MVTFNTDYKDLLSLILDAGRHLAEVRYCHKGIYHLYHTENENDLATRRERGIVVLKAFLTCVDASILGRKLSLVKNHCDKFYGSSEEDESCHNEKATGGKYTKSFARPTFHT